MININKAIELTKSQGGLVFTTPYYLNLFAVRDLSNPNKFNDNLIYYWYDKSGSLYSVNVTKGYTTDPGFTCLVKPQNVKGCAILKEGWWRRLWKKGKHQGKYTALVQANNCIVYRDNNRDHNFDLDRVDTGIFGINLHRANASMTSTVVNGWSAGCQVVADPKEFDQLMLAVTKANQAGQEYFSYMLVNKSTYEK